MPPPNIINTNTNNTSNTISGKESLINTIHTPKIIKNNIVNPGLYRDSYFDVNILDGVIKMKIKANLFLIHQPNIIYKY